MCYFIFLTAAFTLELVLNIYGNWWNKFGYDYWNWFDAVVVAISLISLTMGGVEGIGALRLLRAFRVVRLFKRAASLRKILKAINQAIPGMRDAFAILMLVMMLYAIMGVDFYGPDHDVFFGNFLKAFFTMFQMMTTEGWADIARDVMAEQGDSHAIFFVSFIMLGNIILANVVIAVLIEQVRTCSLPTAPQVFDPFSITVVALHLPLIRRRRTERGLVAPVTSRAGVHEGGRGDNLLGPHVRRFHGQAIGAGPQPVA
jgi:voltage-gated sodium channel